MKISQQRKGWMKNLCGLLIASCVLSIVSLSDSARSQPLLGSGMQSVGLEQESDSLATWMMELTEDNETLEAMLAREKILRQRTIDSLTIRLDLAEKMLEYEKANKPGFIEQWLLPLAMTAGVAIGAAVSR